MDAKKVILSLCLNCDRDKQKAMKAVSLPGVESISMDMKEKKLTVIGVVDPVALVKKLRKICRTDVLSIGPAVEPKVTNEEPKPEPDKPKPVTEIKIDDFCNRYYNCDGFYYPYVRPCYYF